MSTSQILYVGKLIFHPAKIFLLQLRDPNYSKETLNESLINFCVYFNKPKKGFAKSVIQDQHLGHVILLKDKLTNCNNFQKHIYAANATLQRLFRNIYPSNIRLHSHILESMISDQYSIISIAKDFSTNGAPLGTGQRDEQTGREIYDASHFMYCIQSTKVEEAYLREIVPVSIF